MEHAIGRRCLRAVHSWTWRLLLRRAWWKRRVKLSTLKLSHKSSDAATAASFNVVFPLISPHAVESNVLWAKIGSSISQMILRKGGVIIV